MTKSPIQTENVTTPNCQDTMVTESPRTGGVQIIGRILRFLYARLQTGRIMVWWCPSVRPPVRPSVRPSQFSALFSYMLWDIELKFCVSLYFDARKSKFECHEFPSIFAGVMPLFNFKYAVFRTFFLHALRHWAEILHMTLFYCTTDQVRVSSICVNFCGSYAPFGT